jgi:hypothetical protein
VLTIIVLLLNNDVYYLGTVVTDTVPLGANELGGNTFDFSLETNNNNLSDSDESQDNNNNNDVGDETHWPTDIVQESNSMHQFNQQEQVSLSGTPPEWEDVSPDTIMAKVKH